MLNLIVALMLAQTPQDASVPLDAAVSVSMDAAVVVVDASFAVDAAASMASSGSSSSSGFESSHVDLNAAPDKLMGWFRLAVKNRLWGLAAAIALMLTVLVLRKLKPESISAQLAPYIALALAVIPAAALVLKGELPLEEVVATFVTIWLSSGGSWSMPKNIYQHVSAVMAAKSQPEQPAQPEEKK